MKRMTVMLVFSIFCFSSCRPDPPVENNSSEIESSLDDYYQAFEREAALRNLDIDLAGLELISRIAEISEEGVAGTCQNNSHESNIVTIDLEFWNRATEKMREMVVFHELGHCVLGRDHREEENDENSCLSIMNSGTSGCQVRYNEENRVYYLDELFTYSE